MSFGTKGKLTSISLTISVAIFIRFLYVTSLPYVPIMNTYLRIISATISVGTIALTMFFVHKVLARNFLVVVLSGVILTVLPWHIEQSRIYSPAMFALFIILITLTISHFLKSKIVKLFSLCIGISIAFLILPEIRELIIDGWNIKILTFISRLFTLLSIEFLFYANNSQWWIGLRTMGAIYPSMLLPLIIGLIYLFRSHTIQKNLLFSFSFIGILTLSVVVPSYPEQSVYFLTSPLFAYVIAEGLSIIIGYIKYANIIKLIPVILFGLFMFYDFSLFYHFYREHYIPRIKNEHHYEKQP